MNDCALDEGHNREVCLLRGVCLSVRVFGVSVLVC